MLRKGIRTAGLDDSWGYYFNVVSCYPGGTPEETSIRACRPHLRNQLERAPEHVLVCGQIALQALLPGVVGKYANGWPIRAHGKILFPIYHPSYILRLRGNDRYTVGEIWQDQLHGFALLLAGWTAPDVDVKRCIFGSGCNGKPAKGELTCRSHRSRLAKITSQWIDPGIQQSLL